MLSDTGFVFKEERDALYEKIKKSWYTGSGGFHFKCRFLLQRGVITVARKKRTTSLVMSGFNLGIRRSVRYTGRYRVLASELLSFTLHRDNVFIAQKLLWYGLLRVPTIG